MQTRSLAFKALAVASLVALAGCEGELPQAEPEAGVVVLPPIEVGEGDGLPDVLPADLVWETNDADPPFASPEAKRGGTFRTYMLAFPMTVRRIGPDSNGGFAGSCATTNSGR